MSDERIAGLAERLLGDERLRGELPERAAAALTRWGLDQLHALDPAADDAALEQRYAKLRSALLAAAQSGVKTPKRLVARAATLLAASAPQANQPSKPDETTPQRTEETKNTKTGDLLPPLDAAAGLDRLTRALDGGPDQTAHDAEDPPEPRHATPNV